MKTASFVLLVLALFFSACGGGSGGGGGSGPAVTDLWLDNQTNIVWTEGRSGRSSLDYWETDGTFTDPIVPGELRYGGSDFSDYYDFELEGFDRDTGAYAFWYLYDTPIFGGEVTLTIFYN